MNKSLEVQIEGIVKADCELGIFDPCVECNKIIGKLLSLFNSSLTQHKREIAKEIKKKILPVRKFQEYTMGCFYEEELRDCYYVLDKVLAELEI